MTEIPKPIPLKEHELLNFWYSVLNNTHEQAYKESLSFALNMAEDDGVKLEDLIHWTEQENIDPMVRSMCYDALKKGGRQITEEQQTFLTQNPWQKEFWR